MNLHFTETELKKILRNNKGFDVVIIVSSDNNYKYWEWRLRKTRSQILPKKTKIIYVEEKWNNKDGAGQLLGTLNAFNLADRKESLKEMLKKGKSIAIYHTAGKGKRMAPLCGTEKNNKPAIKVPKSIAIDGKNKLFSSLEAAIYSTQIFAETRGGRISVFWGDQIIIPGGSCKIETKLPIEIFGIKKEVTPFSKNNWDKNWKSYGILIPDDRNNFSQREKLTWKQISSSSFAKNKKKFLLQSIGCFSVNLDVIILLLYEFKNEIRTKIQKLDTDPHLWMPLTCNLEQYLKYGGTKKNWQRINKFKKDYENKIKTNLLVGAKGLGSETLWCDYGNLAVYYQNIIKILENTKEAKIQRQFFEIEKFLKNNYVNKELNIKNSIVMNSKIEKGSIKNSIILNSEIEDANLENMVIINSKIKKVHGKQGLLYYLRDYNELKTLPGDAITDIKLQKGERVRMKTKLSRDSKKDWTLKLPENPFSYSEIAKLISKINSLK
jgi:hypothetical protein